MRGNRSSRGRRRPLRIPEARTSVQAVLIIWFGVVAVVLAGALLLVAWLGIARLYAWGEPSALHYSLSLITLAFVVVPAAAYVMGHVIDGDPRRGRREWELRISDWPMDFRRTGPHVRPYGYPRGGFPYAVGVTPESTVRIKGPDGVFWVDVLRIGTKLYTSFSAPTTGPGTYSCVTSRAFWARTGKLGPIASPYARTAAFDGDLVVDGVETSHVRRFATAGDASDFAGLQLNSCLVRWDEGSVEIVFRGAQLDRATAQMASAALTVLARAR